MAVGDIARRVRADHDAGQQVADDRRKPESVGEIAKDQRGSEAAGEGEDEVMHVGMGKCRRTLPIRLLLSATF
jgi:hypothetical protein